jgi:hypothetical protein
MMMAEFGCHTSDGGVFMITEQKIKELAYAMWEEQGCPEGNDLANYFGAERILQEQQASSVIELTSSPISILRRPQPEHQLAPAVVDIPPGQYKYRRHNHS